MSEGAANTTAAPLPYAGIRVVEFTHMVMGPTCGMLLADLGAEVIKVEPIEGDNTRRLLGSGAGFFPTFNRNKKSIALDLKKPEGVRGRAAPDRQRRHRQRELQARHDGEAGPRLRQPAEAQSAPDLRQPQGLPARPLRPPHRARRGGADDGRPGLHDRPRRATRCARAPASTTSWAACSAPSARWPRCASASAPAEGCEVQAALFENNVFLVAQHMMQFAVTGQRRRPDAQPHLGLGACTTCSPSRTASRSSWRS